MTTKGDIDDITEGLEDSINGMVSAKTLKILGNIANDFIIERTRGGRGVSRPGRAEQPLKALSSKYKSFRRNNKRFLHRSTSPNKSNLTFTGQMLESMKVTVRGDTIRIGPQGRRKDGKNNANVAKWVSIERPFNFLSKEDIYKILKFYGKELETLLRRNKLL